MVYTGTESGVGAGSPMLSTRRYHFANTPVSDDFQHLAAHLEQVPLESLHSVLRPNRDAIVAGLQRMAGAPHTAAHQSAYHALRLFV